METLLDAVAVAKHLKVSKRTLESLIARDMTPPYFYVGRQRRWRQRDIEEWVCNQLETSLTSTCEDTLK